MANNRLALVCKICNPDGWTWQDDVIQLMRYYPSTGWYIPISGDPGMYILNLNLWLERHVHDRYPAEDPNYFMKGPDGPAPKHSGPYNCAEQWHIQMEYESKETVNENRTSQ